MKKKKFNGFYKKICLIFIFLFNFSLIFAQKSKWTIAAEPFILKNNKNEKILLSTAQILPTLVLESINENLIREVKSQEKLDRKLYEFQKERLSLFLQLSNETKNRDELFLNNYSKNTLKRKISDSQKKIKEIEIKISNNLKETEKIKKEYSEKIKIEEDNKKKLENGLENQHDKNGFLNFFGNYEAPVIEKIELYQSDFRILYKDLNSSENFDYESMEVQNKLVSANINCLITGKITSYGEFISVSIVLYNYPGGKILGYATDVGSVTDLNPLAQNLAHQINPKLTDVRPVKISVKIFPEEARKKCNILIDNSIFNQRSDEFLLSAGIHTLSFSSPDYDTVSTSYNFSGHKDFEVEVNLEKKVDGFVNLRLNTPYEGKIFANGNYSGEISAEEPFSKIKINGNNVLAHFINTDGSFADFYIPQKLLLDGANLKVDAKTFNRSDYIEKRRKIMYASYSALMISLMPYFFCYGNYNSFLMANKNGTDIDFQEGNRWQVASNVTGGISIAAGCFFVYELVRYLVAANSVLPVTAKKLSEKDLIKFEKSDKKYIEKLEKQKEKQKQLEEEQKKVEENLNNSENQLEESEEIQNLDENLNSNSEKKSENIENQN